MEIKFRYNPHKEEKRDTVFSRMTKDQKIRFDRDVEAIKRAFARYVVVR